MQNWISILLLALPGIELVSAAKPSVGCNSTSPLAAGNHTLTVNNKSRWYLLKLPEPYQNNHPYRLIFTLHAAGGDAGMVANGTGGYLPWYGMPAEINDTVGAIYVSPNGLDRAWRNQGGEDTTLISDITAAVKNALCVDENLLFSVGFSFGGSMTNDIACALAKDFRAVAMQSGGSLSNRTCGTDPIAFYGQHGVSGDINITNARAIRDRAVKNNGCTPTPFTSPTNGSGIHTKLEYPGCREGYPVTWIEYDGGHTPQPKDKGQNQTWAADEVWKFWSQFK